MTDPGIMERLRQAVLAPESKDAKALAKMVMPLTASMSAKIPFSQGQMRAAFPHMMGSNLRFGVGWLFASESCLFDPPEQRVGFERQVSCSRQWLTPANGAR